MEKFNIAPVLELPGVGENFQDHISVSVGAELSGQHITAENMQDPTFAEEQLLLYRESKSGMLSSTPSTFVFIPAADFIPADVLQGMIAALDEALSAPLFKESPWQSIYEMQRSWLKNNSVAQLEIVLFPAYETSEADHNEASQHYSLMVFPQHCWNCGSVHLESSSGLDPPAIDYQILNSPGDFDLLLLVYAIRYAFKIMQTGSLGAETSRILEPLPTWTDDQLKDYVRKKVNSAWHPVGTASMLPLSNNGVVDENLKVDASIIPVHVGTHPQATLYGIAHRAAQIIEASDVPENKSAGEEDHGKGCCDIA
ncbi:FAD-linked reductase [Heliocybe sulcata]|uniref:FAD-linked reductase n=1 Tax=Heliocybe sulcata TaxID=5364 RepID=A0A5C3NCE8_9AGAM|nr:FAD-linked reductase [Heliocybe sulcata]